jgi:hypothetical protein
VHPRTQVPQSHQTQNPSHNLVGQMPQYGYSQPSQLDQGQQGIRFNQGAIRDTSSKVQFSQLSLDSGCESQSQRIAKLELLLRDEKDRSRDFENRAAFYEEEARKCRVRIQELEGRNRELESRNSDLLRQMTVIDVRNDAGLASRGTASGRHVAGNGNDLLRNHPTAFGNVRSHEGFGSSDVQAQTGER